MLHLAVYKISLVKFLRQSRCNFFWQSQLQFALRQENENPFRKRKIKYRSNGWIKLCFGGCWCALTLNIDKGIRRKFGNLRGMYRSAPIHDPFLSFFLFSLEPVKIPSMKKRSVKTRFFHSSKGTICVQSQKKKKKSRARRVKKLA